MMTWAVPIGDSIIAPILFYYFNLFLIYAWIPAQGPTWPAASVCCWLWFQAQAQVQVPRRCPARWRQGLDEAAFVHPPTTSAGHKRHQQGLSPVLPCSGTCTAPNSTRYRPSPRCCLTFRSPCHSRFFSLIYLHDLPILFEFFFPFFSFSRPLHLPSCWALSLLLTFPIHCILVLLLPSLYHPFFHHDRHSTFLRG